MVNMGHSDKPTYDELGEHHREACVLINEQRKEIEARDVTIGEQSARIAGLEAVLLSVRILLNAAVGSDS